MPGDETEVPIQINRFVGVNQLDQPTQLDPSVLQASVNFIPSPTYSLAVRPGTTAYQTAINTPLGITALARAVDTAGNTYLYAYVQIAAGDQLQVSTNGGAFTLVTGGTFASHQKQGGLTVMNGEIWAGNGVDPLKFAPLGGSATDAVPPGLANDTGQAAAPVADTQSLLVSGTYSYRWCVYDTSTLAYPFVGPVETIIVSGRQDVTFTAPQATAPATVLTGTQTWHCFVTEPNQPIELAVDQTQKGLAAAATFTMVAVAGDGAPVPIPSTFTRTGRFFSSHLGRLFFAGDTVNPRNVEATNVFLQGLEQQLFNQANFFPADAFDQIDEPTTGVGVITVTSTPDQPVAPLVVFSHSQTWLLFGDILNDPNATFPNLSKRIGCVSQATIANTPIGLIFLGPESVYLLQPSLTEPIDIGWPIEPSIRAIAGNLQAGCVAVYHQGFYKLCIPRLGDVTNTNEWWLDLRPRVREQVVQFPSWWGPHLTGAPLSAATASTIEAAKDDVAWGAVAGTGTVVNLHQPAITDNGVSMAASFKTARFTWGDSFARKRLKRARAIGQSGAAVLVPVTVTADQSLATVSTWNFPNAPGGIWDVGIWDVALWGSDIFVEADTQTSANPISGAGEIMGQAMELQASYNVVAPLQIRDVELRVQILPRKVA